MAKILITVFFLFCISLINFNSEAAAQGASGNKFPLTIGDLFATNFAGIKIPNESVIKKMGENKSFSYAAFEDVWSSVILLMMQIGVIAHSSRESGIIVAVLCQPKESPPIVFLVQRGEIITVFLTWIQDFQEIPSTNRIKFTTSFFNLLAEQVYSREKWKYLYDTKIK